MLSKRPNRGGGGREAYLMQEVKPSGDISRNIQFVFPLQVTLEEPR